jgi:hypothetical protein
MRSDDPDAPSPRLFPWQDGGNLTPRFTDWRRCVSDDGSESGYVSRSDTPPTPDLVTEDGPPHVARSASDSSVSDLRTTMTSKLSIFEGERDRVSRNQQSESRPAPLKAVPSKPKRSKEELLKRNAEKLERLWEKIELMEKSKPKEEKPKAADHLKDAPPVIRMIAKLNGTIPDEEEDDDEEALPAGLMFEVAVATKRKPRAPSGSKKAPTVADRLKHETTKHLDRIKDRHDKEERAVYTERYDRAFSALRLIRGETHKSGMGVSAPVSGLVPLPVQDERPTDLELSGYQKIVEKSLEKAMVQTQKKIQRERHQDSVVAAASAATKTPGGLAPPTLADRHRKPSDDSSSQPAHRAPVVDTTPPGVVLFHWDSPPSLRVPDAWINSQDMLCPSTSPLAVDGMMLNPAAQLLPFAMCEQAEASELLARVVLSLAAGMTTDEVMQDTIEVLQPKARLLETLAQGEKHLLPHPEGCTELCPKLSFRPGAVYYSHLLEMFMTARGEVYVCGTSGVGHLCTDPRCSLMCLDPAKGEWSCPVSRRVVGGLYLAENYTWLASRGGGAIAGGENGEEGGAIQGDEGLEEEAFADDMPEEIADDYDVNSKAAANEMVGMCRDHEADLNQLEKAAMEDAIVMLESMTTVDVPAESEETLAPQPQRLPLLDHLSDDDDSDDEVGDEEDATRETETKPAARTPAPPRPRMIHFGQTVSMGSVRRTGVWNYSLMKTLARRQQRSTLGMATGASPSSSSSSASSRPVAAGPSKPASSWDAQSVFMPLSSERAPKEFREIFQAEEEKMKRANQKRAGKTASLSEAPVSRVIGQSATIAIFKGVAESRVTKRRKKKESEADRQKTPEEKKADKLKAHAVKCINQALDRMCARPYEYQAHRKRYASTHLEGARQVLAQPGFGSQGLLQTLSKLQFRGPRMSLLVAITYTNKESLEGTSEPLEAEGRWRLKELGARVQEAINAVIDAQLLKADQSVLGQGDVKLMAEFLIQHFDSYDDLPDTLDALREFEPPRASRHPIPLLCPGARGWAPGKTNFGPLKNKLALLFRQISD